MSTTVERPLVNVGRGVDRVDGPLKVTGTARYAADAPIAHPLHGVLVQSTISKGRIQAIDETAARCVDGVVEVLTHRNAPRIAQTGFDFVSATFTEPNLTPLQTDAVLYWGQHVAVVLATTFEAAATAAALLRVTYRQELHETELDARTRAHKEKVDSFFGSPLNVGRGDPDGAFRSAAATIDATYTTPMQTHNAMEPSATVAHWSNGELTVYDSTQWINGTQNTLAHFFGIDPKHVHVISPFIGGGFGSKGFSWPATVIAAMAAKATGRAVKIVVDRGQFFTSNGHRSETEQRVRIGATPFGKLTALIHDVIETVGHAGDFHEPAGKSTDFLYEVPNLRVTHNTVRLDISTPTAMRAPGETPGSFAIESALDELAYAVNADPIALRVRNHAAKDPQRGTPFSSKHLLECYRTGAERFGWNARTPQPRSMREGNEFVGYGMATATYPAMAGAAAVHVRADGGGRVTVECATHDLGTGMYTIIAQVASDALGISLANITVKIGDSAYPKAPVAGGSQSTASVMPPLFDACEALKRKAGGNVAGAPAGLEASGSGSGEVDEEKHAFHSFGAQFCEVRYDEDLARLRVTRFTGVFDCGRILNPKTARSQMMGGIVMGLGMALMEQTVRDRRSGAIVTNNLADYHLPVNADVPPIDIAFVERPDLTFNALGVRGIGEIGITGVAAAVANAVYHASGRRVRNLPIVPERLL